MDVGGDLIYYLVIQIMFPVFFSILIDNILVKENIFVCRSVCLSGCLSNWLFLISL